MKKLVFIMSMLLISSGFLYAQDGNNYRARNHKLSKHNNSLKKEKKNVIPINQNKTEVGNDGYLSRNSKFHKTTSDKNLVIKKEEVNNDYRAWNHKLNKSNKIKAKSESAPQSFVTQK